MATSNDGNTQQVWRQGDVWIYRISRTEWLRRRRAVIAGVAPDLEKGIVLAEGEVTGHHHRIPKATSAKLYSQVGTQTRLLDVKARTGVAIVHEEHETIELPPGHYEVRIQREYEPSERSKTRYVAD